MSLITHQSARATPHNTSASTTSDTTAKKSQIRLLPYFLSDPMSLDLAAVHDVALDIVEKAGRLAFSYFDNIERLTVEFKEARDDLKTHHSPVTQADLQVEQLIRACIQQSYPDHGIIGEEYENE